MRRDAKAMVAYFGLAELKAALDPRQRFVDEITAVGRSMAEVSPGQPLVSSADHAAPLTGGLIAGARALAKSCGLVASTGKISRAFGAGQRVFTGKHVAEPRLWQVLDLFRLACISKMRGINRSARVTRVVGGLTSARCQMVAPECRARREPETHAFGLVDTLSNVCLGPAPLPSGPDRMAAGTRPNF
ncbi:hypothetical protein BjapCC829_06350 [Bradyrhizobium barranii]|uniref:Uncharacterized protein n=1 Tax=Bradyrhizobium barranii TaxID=2992140 RepID=A0ABY3QRG7_9BRAD|nr:hypothetical protein [Bradyrhizobium japonicum]UFW88213.1 hypothetical protein BjapCC829_06350 [Bradyrhizobium japonicum]